MMSALERVESRTMRFDQREVSRSERPMLLTHSASAVSRALPSSSPTISLRLRFLLLVALGASADLLSKALATNLLSDGHTVSISDRLAFMLVYNTGGAGGLMVGAHSWNFNVVITVAAIALVAVIVAPLAAVDPRATWALGLVTGGAVGNLASMVAGPEGVADFFAVNLGSSTTVVMNVADLLLWVGALLLAPVVVRLIGAVYSERSVRAQKPM